MTIQEAIDHCREEAAKNRTRAVEHANAYDRKNAEACHECAQEHKQLAAWLKELQRRRGRAVELAALEALRKQVHETGRVRGISGEVVESVRPCVAAGVCAAIQTLIDLTNDETIRREERGDTPTARYVGGKHERWVGVEVEGQSGAGPVYAKVTCTGCGFENDHEPAYCECCGARMDAEEESGT